MRALRLHGPGDLRLDELPDPEPGPGEVRLRVTACGICGTDLRYLRLGGLAGPAREPMPLGHELVGVVDAVGPGVGGVGPGLRVVVHPTAGGAGIGNGGPEGGFATALRIRDARLGVNLFPVPEAIPDELAALAEPLGVGLHAADRLLARPEERIAIFGAGPIGLATLVALLDRGVDDVAVVDRSPLRLDLARQLGAAATVDAGREDPFARLRELHGRSPVLGAPMCGTDGFVEASGSAEVLRGVLAHARRGARLVVVALHDREVPVSFLQLLVKELTVRGAMEYAEDFAAGLGLLARRDLSPLVTHRFELDRFREAFATAARPEAAGKVLIRVQGAAP